MHALLQRYLTYWFSPEDRYLHTVYFDGLQHVENLLRHAHDPVWTLKLACEFSSVFDDDDVMHHALFVRIDWQSEFLLRLKARDERFFVCRIQKYNEPTLK